MYYVPSIIYDVLSLNSVHWNSLAYVEILATVVCSIIQKQHAQYWINKEEEIFLLFLSVHIYDNI